MIHWYFWRTKNHVFYKWKNTQTSIFFLFVYDTVISSIRISNFDCRVFISIAENLKEGKKKKMEIHHSKHESWSDTESTSSSRVGYSGPLSGPILVNNANKKHSSKKSARFKDGDEYVEITLDIREDSVSVQNIKGGDPETAMLATKLEKRPSFGSQLSFKIRQVSQELKRMTSMKAAAPFNRADRNKSGAARALRGLKFMTKNVGTEGWSEIESRFDELSVNGSLPKSLFGQCIGIYNISPYLQFFMLSGSAMKIHCCYSL